MTPKETRPRIGADQASLSWEEYTSAMPDKSISRDEALWLAAVHLGDQIRDAATALEYLDVDGTFCGLPQRALKLRLLKRAAVSLREAEVALREAKWID